jgi:flagellar biosynthetic protein FliR
MIIAGFLILIISMESIGARIEWLWVQGFNVVRDVMGVPHV